jgi:hypothetical protein
MLNIDMNGDNNNPQSGGQNLQKLEEDLRKITNEAASTTQSAPVVSTQPVQEQPTSVSPPQIMTPAQPIEVPPAPTSIPVDGGKKGISVMVIAIVLLIVAMVVAVGYVAYTKFMTPKAVQTACTLEAKLCPDGSSVGRVGPDCEFAACPTVIATPIETSMASATPSATPISVLSPSPSASSTPSATATP